ncbi:hypothetical protein G4B88_016032 [Cannabis sativa]|uniref:AtC3H46-like PABC-like domain-containing protein n=1 Tax=Cannabis sativa TaxID=3483 RepID=A0A7J6EXP8_CANSA|nr:hypothetical protein G4B88_016032 [Cannabis sativa]
MEAVITIDVLRRARADELRVDACHVAKIIADTLITDYGEQGIFVLITLPDTLCCVLIQELEPENVTKIIGYLLLNDYDDQQFSTVGFCSRTFCSSNHIKG